MILRHFLLRAFQIYCICVFKAVAAVSALLVVSGCTIIESAEYPVDTRNIILTFDDGPSESISTELLDVLQKHQVKATFCYVGRNVMKAPQLVSRAYKEGHEFAIHSFDRNYPTLWTASTLEIDIQKTRSAIYGAVGHENFTIDLYRPPRGLVTLSVIKATKRLDLDLAHITFYSYDAPAGPDKAAKVLRSMQRNLKRYNGGAIVFHESRFKPDVEEDDNVNKTWVPDAVDQLIVWAKDHGYKFVQYPKPQQANSQL